MKTNKTLLWVGIGSALLIGGGLFWWFRKSAQEKEAAKLAQEAADKANQEKEKEIVQKEKVEDNTPTLPSTPFKNKTEGDAFRVWMSSAHPDYKYKNDTLGKSGEYNNSFMRDAYSKYGNEYSLYLKKPSKYKFDDKLEALLILPKGGEALSLNGTSYGFFKDAYFVKDLDDNFFIGKVFAPNSVGGKSWTEAKLRKGDWQKYTVAAIKYF